jgi:hypothetical protein
MTRLVWIKGPASEWLSFEMLNLSRVSANGVYIIWYGGPKPGIVRVGQGDISSRLKLHRGDPIILVYKSLGIFVKWAEVLFFSKTAFSVILLISCAQSS